MDYDRERFRVLTRRALLLGGAQLGLFALLGARLYYLQVLESDTYKVMADENRINVRLVAPQRGRILDRFGVPLATNRQNYRVVLVPEETADIPATLRAIGLLIPLDETDKAKFARDIRQRLPFVPIVVKDNLSWAELSRIEINIVELPGVSIETGFNRYYPLADRAAHVVGYVAPASEAEVTDDPVLELPDFRIGKNGVEKSQDLELRGSAGTDEIEVNALGRIVRDVARDDGEPGQDVTLAIDSALQELAVARLADQQSGSLVLMDAPTGEVLVMASVPGYDANAFTRGLPESLWQSLTTNPLGPLNNKAIQGVYPPGSTFKPCVAMAALDAGVITPEFTVTCVGHISLGDTQFHCWRKGGHGTLDLHGAIQHSCDVYFYEVARRLGVDGIAAMANRLGFGKPVGIDIPSERGGLIPTRAWKRKATGIAWQNGETLSVGIGQGYVSSTPLQLCTMVARLVTNRAIVPRVVRPDRPDAGDRDSPVDADRPADDFEPLNLDPGQLAAVLSGMAAVVNEPGGTAYASRILEPGLEMGGKSGTAQVRRISAEERAHGLRKPEDLPWNERDHALFVAFAPVSAPRYVAAIVVEHGMHGAAIAPILRDMMIACQKRDPVRNKPMAAVTLPSAAGNAATAVPSDDSGEVAD